jgi:AcrR family transcriptional regulator
MTTRVGSAGVATRKSSTPRTPPRAARLPGEERREHFLDVARELITEQSVDSVTMEAVAAAAGVSKGLGYAYFTNRGDLLLAVLEREMKELERRVGEALAAGDTFEARIRGAVHAWLDTVSERGGLLNKLLQASPLQKPLRERRAASYRRIEAFYGRMAADEFGIPMEEAVAAAAIMVAGLSGLLERWVVGRDSRKMLEDTFVRLTIGGLKNLGEPEVSA